MRQTFDTDICYLCGQEIGNTTPTMDHVPPRRLYPSQYRRARNTQLLTLKTHPQCHKPFGRDEEYFFNTMLPHGLAAPVGDELSKDFRRTLKHAGGRRLAETVEHQFVERPGGLILPKGQWVQRFDGDRMERVIRKIVRGLHYYERGHFLADRNVVGIRIYGPMDGAPPEPVIALMGEPSHGDHPEVFDYKVWPDPDLRREFWLLLLWETFIVVVSLHTPSCACAQCFGDMDT